MSTTASLDVRLKRAYEAPADSDGTRVLIDRLWPRGVSKATACIDQWLREIAPSTELRQWFGHDPRRWPQFQRRYTAELREREATLEALRALATRGPLTLVYGARDVEHNDAVVLRQVLLVAAVRSPHRAVSRSRSAPPRRAPARERRGTASPSAAAAPAGNEPRKPRSTSRLRAKVHKGGR